jgi:hypothetical protein
VARTVRGRLALERGRDAPVELAVKPRVVVLGVEPRLSRGRRGGPLLLRERARGGGRQQPAREPARCGVHRREEVVVVTVRQQVWRTRLHRSQSPPFDVVRSTNDTSCSTYHDFSSVSLSRRANIQRD